GAQGGGSDKSPRIINRRSRSRSGQQGDGPPKSRAGPDSGGAPSIPAGRRTSPYHARPPLRRGGCARADQAHQGNAGAVGEPAAAQRRRRSGLHDRGTPVSDPFMPESQASMKTRSV